MTKKKAVILCIVIAVILLAFFGIRNAFLRDCEQTYETDDLECMRCADVAAQTILQSGKVDQKTTYYFDANNFSLVATDQKPEAYGIGTKVKGNTVEKYNADNNTQYTYDESADYTDKIIQVTIDPEAPEGNQILVEWVQ